MKNFCSLNQMQFTISILKKYNYDLPQIPSYKFNERVNELDEKIKLNIKIDN